MFNGVGMWSRILTFGLPAIVIGALLGWALSVQYYRPSHSQRDAAILSPQELRSNPQKYAGQVVRLTGQLDECFGWECSLCPGSMTNAYRDPKQCLALEFRPLIPGTGFGEEEQESVLRFADVVLEAKFDPECWRSSCLDRQTVLYHAHVVSVEKRRPSRAGLWLGDTNAITEVREPIASDLKKAALAAGFPEGPPLKAYTIQGNGSLAVVCWTPPGITPESWPTTLEGAVSAPSKSDFYRCNKVHRNAGQWIVQVHD